ncbi:MAG: glutamate racemase [Clostridiaceae bacterium]|nr:glutamate racemase [Clostridiaceae bacterium]
MDTRPIGMFDSGVGGLTVLKEVIKQNPKENIIYLGDTKSFPYGSKSKDSIIELTKKGIEFLISKNVKIVIIACGTATSQALEEVKDNYPIPVIGIIDSTVEYIKNNEKLKKIGIIATAGTIRSNGWQNKIESKIKDVVILNKSCPLLAPMAEEGWTENEIAKLTIREYLKELKNIDCLILGCTHYPLFKKIIQEELGQSVEIINTGEKLSKDLEKELKESKKDNSENKNGDFEIYLTDTETNFIHVAEKLLKEEKISNKINKVEL